MVDSNLPTSLRAVDMNQQEVVVIVVIVVALASIWSIVALGARTL